MILLKDNKLTKIIFDIVDDIYDIHEKYVRGKETSVDRSRASIESHCASWRPRRDRDGERGSRYLARGDAAYVRRLKRRTQKCIASGASVQGLVRSSPADSVAQTSSKSSWYKVTLRKRRMTRAPRYTSRARARRTASRECIEWMLMPIRTRLQ